MSEMTNSLVETVMHKKKEAKKVGKEIGEKLRVEMQSLEN